MADLLQLINNNDFTNWYVHLRMYILQVHVTRPSHTNVYMICIQVDPLGEIYFRPWTNNNSIALAAKEIGSAVNL